jgi:Cu2+-exporting ATPase
VTWTDSDDKSTASHREGAAALTGVKVARADPFYSRHMSTDKLELAALDDPAELGSFTRWSAARDGRRVAESSFRLDGMHCATCALTIESALRAVHGVLDATVNAAARCATVRWDAELTRASRLADAVRRAGYQAVPDTAAEARSLRQRERRQMTWRAFVALFCAMQVMMFATPAYVGGDLTPDLKRLLDWGSWLLSLPVLLFSAAPFFAGAWRSLRMRTIGMDVPVAIGIAVAFVASSGATFDPGGVLGSDVYFDSLTMFVGFLLVGRWLEMAARHRAAETLEQAIGQLPQRVMRVLADGTVEVVGLQRLRAGDTLRIPVGQAFAADGVLTHGNTQANESLLTGESRPVAKQVGDGVVAGSVNLGAPVEMRVERAGADTRYEAIVALMREARSHRPSLARSADRWAKPFLWCVLLLAAAAAAVWSVIEPSRAIWVAVSVLIVTCPCALSLAAPSALLAAAGASARRGVLWRRLDAIEALARVSHLFVDKTGTLTETQLRCVNMQRFGSLEGALMRRTAGSLAAWSQHPLARALREGIGGAELALHAVQETAGLGLEAEDGAGHVWRLGSAAWCEATDHTPGVGVWLARDGRPVARFDFDERLREDSAGALAALRHDGVRVTLLSGDGAPRVEHFGAELALDQRLGALSPEGKLAALREAQASGDVVAMVGDGINDAPVLAQADVSFAMGEGALVARANADAVLLSDSLRDVASARLLARRTMRVIRQNMLWAAAYNAACVPLAIGGWLPPWAAGLGMATSSLFVVLNSLRLAR